DADGDPILVGSSGPFPEGWDFLTLKYSGEDAALRAIHYFDGGDQAYDAGYAVAIAPDGSLRVGGDARTLGTERMTVVALRDAPDFVFSDGFEPLLVPRVQSVVAVGSTPGRD